VSKRTDCCFGFSMQQWRKAKNVRVVGGARDKKNRVSGCSCRQPVIFDIMMTPHLHSEKLREIYGAAHVRVDERNQFEQLLVGWIPTQSLENISEFPRVDLARVVCVWNEQSSAAFKMHREHDTGSQNAGHLPKASNASRQASTSC